MTSTEEQPEPERRRRLQPFASFQYQGYRWLWATNVTYGAVLGAQSLLISWLIIEDLNRTYNPGYALLAGSLPVLLLALPAGRMADRGDRRLLLLGSHVAMALVLLLTAVLAVGDLLSLGLTFLLMGLGAAAAAIGQPVRLALIPALVPRERILNANVLGDLGLALGALVGGLVTTFVASQWGAGPAFLVLTITPFIGAVFVIRLYVPPREAEAEKGEGVEGGSLGGGVGEGFLFLWGKVELRLLFVLLGLAVFLAPWLALNFAAIEEQLDLSVRAWALLGLLSGLGLLVSTIALAFVFRIRRAGAWYGVLLIASAVVAGGIWFSSSYALTGFLMALSGLALGVRGLLVVTLVQSHTPIAVMGRVMGIYVALTAGASLLAQPITRAGQFLLQDDGWIVCSAIVLVGVVAVILWRNPGLRRMPSHPEPESMGDEAAAEPGPG